MELHDKLKALAGILLIVSAITHVAQLFVYGFEGHVIGAALYGSTYLILGILLIKYPKNKLISVIGAVHPAIGGILGTNRLITYYIQATGDINYFIVFHVVVDIIVVSICIYSLVKLRKQEQNIQG